MKSIGIVLCTLALTVMLSGCVVYGGGGYYHPYRVYPSVGMGVGVY